VVQPVLRDHARPLASTAGARQPPRLGWCSRHPGLVLRPVSAASGAVSRERIDNALLVPDQGVLQVRVRFDVEARRPAGRAALPRQGPVRGPVAPVAHEQGRVVVAAPGPGEGAIADEGRTLALGACDDVNGAG
jgi:hypothetical protein